MGAAPRVAVVDYGGSNLLSVVRALRHCGAEIVLAEDAAAIGTADRLVLPGVGAFGDVRNALADRGLIDPIRAYAETGRPFLGICVGMQLMMDCSEEFGRHEGLGLISGAVEAIPREGAGGAPHRIPHIGWEPLAAPGGAVWDGTILSHIEQGAAVYFVHSFTAVPEDDRYRLADCDYDGIRISAAIARDSLYGCQFHPEKSGPIGLRILGNFIGLEAKCRERVRP